MTLEEIDAFIRENKISVAAFSPDFNGFGAKEWGVQWKKSGDGVTLDISKRGPTLLDAMGACLAAWTSATRRGLPQLTAAQIEHTPPQTQAHPQTAADLDDEIPF